MTYLHDGNIQDGVNQELVIALPEVCATNMFYFMACAFENPANVHYACGNNV